MRVTITTIVAGLILIGVGVALYTSAVRYDERAIVVDAIVTRNDVRTMAGGRSQVYYPVVAFKTPDGAAVEAVSPEGSVAAPSFRVGDAVKVNFDPGAPDEIRLGAQAPAGIGAYLQAALSGGLGAALLLVNAIVFLRHRLRRGQRFATRSAGRGPTT